MPKPRSENRQRTSFLRARVTPEEHAIFRERCAAVGLSDADYIRRRCIDITPLRKRRKRPLDEQALANALGQLMRIGNNVNQMAHALNIAKMKPGAAATITLLTNKEDQFAEMQAAILESRNLIRQALLRHDIEG